VNDSPVGCQSASSLSRSEGQIPNFPPKSFEFYRSSFYALLNFAEYKPEMSIGLMT